jgi:hypothetical protein
VLVGYDPAGGLFTFAHSRGTSWGADGFGTMSRKAAEALLDFSSARAVAPAVRQAHVQSQVGGQDDAQLEALLPP